MDRSSDTCYNPEPEDCSGQESVAAQATEKQRCCLVARLSVPVRGAFLRKGIRWLMP